MRRSHYLVLILLLIAQTTFGQVYQNMAQPGYKFGRARFDSVLTIPSGLGNLKNISGGQDTGQIRFNKSDSSVYVWNGRAWIKPVGGGADTTKIPLAGTAVGKPITGDLEIDNLAGNKRIKGNSSSSYIEFTDDGGININETTGSNVNVMGVAFNAQNAGGSDGMRGIKNYSANYNSLNFIQKVYSDSITNLKLNKTDTAAMLAPYTRVTVSSYGKNATADSTILLLSNGTRYAAKDSVGGGGSMAIGGTITSATAGSALFAGTSGVLAQDNANYFWDNTNKRLGIGTATPAHRLDVVGGETRLFPRGAVNGSFIFTNTDVYNKLNMNNIYNIIQQTNATAGGWMDIASAADLYIGAGTGKNLYLGYDIENGRSSNVTVGATTAAAASAILDVRSTTKGLLIPRMTTTQRDAIATPATGLQVYNTTTNTNDVYNGTAWSGGWNLTGNVSAITDFLGTTNNRTMRFRTNNVERMVIDSTGSVGIGTATPAGKLDIRRNDALGASSLYIINASTTGANNIMLGENVANKNLGFGWFPSGSTTFQSLIPSTAYMYASSEASQLSLNTSTATQPITFCTNNWVERMRVTGAGRLLLGKTTESTFIFDAVGNSRISGNMNFGSVNQTSTFANSNYLFIGNGNISSGNSTTPDLSLSSNVYYNGTNNVYTKTGFSSTFYLSQAGDFQFYTTATGTAAATATLNEKMRLTNAGSLLIGTTTENTSAALNVTSTTQGVLFPRMTTVQKLAIGTPAAGLQVYDSTLNQMSYYNGTAWVNF